MTRNPPTARLRPDSAFAPVFPDGCPIQSPIPEQGRFAGDVEDFYRCDFARCSEEQRQSVAELVAQACGATAAEVLAHWQSESFLPLRGRNVEGTSFDTRLL